MFLYCVRFETGKAILFCIFTLNSFHLFYLVAKNCAELHESGNKTSGVFIINPDNEQVFRVFCDQNTEGGGWTVFQKRLDGSVDFDRNWTDYKQGFGNLSGEFWLGLDKIQRLTSQTNKKLRVELEDFQGNTAYAEYNMFAVADEAENYRLSVGGYTDAGNTTILPWVYLSWTSDLMMESLEQSRNFPNTICVSGWLLRNLMWRWALWTMEQSWRLRKNRQQNCDGKEADRLL